MKAAALKATHSENEESGRTSTVGPPIVWALASTLRVRDAETQGHSERVVKFSLMLGTKLGLSKPELEALAYGSLLHDIGKIGVPDAILRKPGRLTEVEWIKMREHPLLGMQILKGIESLEDASLVVAQHHERWDGNGYPFRLRSIEIDRNARIFAVADAFDAMTSDRVYQSRRSYETALLELTRCAGHQFDPEVVQAFALIQPQSWLDAMKGTDDNGFSIRQYQNTH
jgi:HD-GYP domain-containing protein (c-di-GMP phosphodiesterase class II)